MNEVHNKVLIVDDEVEITSALTQLFESHGYPVISTNLPSSALEIVKSEPIAVVISGYDMPELNGVRMLATMKAINPQCKRILLTASTEFDAVVDAINSGSIYKFLLKPWNDTELLSIVCEALAHYELEEKNKILSYQLKQANRRLKTINEYLGLRLW